MNLYLDDIRNLPSGWVGDWVVVRSVAEAKKLLATGQVECASLDHDMGDCDECANAFPQRGYPMVSATCRHLENGYDLVKWMVATGYWPKRKPLCHSANPVGRAAILQAIERFFPR